ncbi:MAG: cyclic pyranopterin monophosphate synthase MoaC [Alphaproteobacteria bacterium]
MAKKLDLPHLDSSGRARMVDISDKGVTDREAIAEARVVMLPETARVLRAGRLSKGDALVTARIAGIQAAKRTDELIPLCHQIPLSHVDVEMVWGESRAGKVVLTIRVCCRATARTGVEMEALTAASVAALTVYDFCKGVERGVVLERIRLVSKKGGKSGNYKVS